MAEHNFGDGHQVFDGEGKTCTIWEGMGKPRKETEKILNTVS
jgi:hypothetical protein